METETLRYILHRDNSSILHKIKPMEETKKDVKIVAASISNIKKKISEFQNEEANLKNSKLGVQESVMRVNDLMSIKINDYLNQFKQQEFEKQVKLHLREVHDKEALNEINKKNELKNAKKKLKEIMKEEDQSRFKDSLERLKKQQTMFAKIQS